LGVTAFDFFRTSGLPVPAVDDAQARTIATEYFGVAGTITALGSQQDANFLISDHAGVPVGVLKIANPAFSLVELQAQDAAAAFIAAGEGVRTATNREFDAVAPIAQIDVDGGLFVRIISYLDGGTLSGDGYLNPARVRALGDLAGRTTRALAGFDHAGVDRVLQWDLRHGMRTVETLAEHVADISLREELLSAAARAWAAVAGLVGDLPVQVIHGDVTDDNVVCDAHGLPDGLIDFGDLTRSWTIGELAIAVASVLRHDGAEPASTMAAIAGFHAVRPLSPAEITALWPLVVLRASVLVVSGLQQSVIDVENAYANTGLDPELRIFQRANGIPLDVMTAQIRHVLGNTLPAKPISAEAPLIAGLDPADITRLDLSVESDAMDAGAWLDTDCEDRLARDAISAGAAAVLSTFGEAHLTRSATLSEVSPPTVATGVRVWPSRSLTLTAPWPGVVETTLSGEHPILTLSGVAGTIAIRGGLRPAGAGPSGRTVAAGAVLGSIESPVWIQCRRPFDVGATDDGGAPDFVQPDYAAGWLNRVSDPAVLLGFTPATAPTDDSAGLRRRRSQSFAESQEHYYRHPPRIERGWREHLISTDGRSYLDMINNVAVLGHGHPAVADAVARQWRRLNTNSRFNYASVVALSERLVATLPDPLDTVFLVNSGSEADDLALRLAMATTGRHDVVAVAEAYHGWTYATDAISTSVADNPNALSTRPSWVHTVPSPNAYRGEHRGAQASKYASEAVAIIDALAAQGHPPAAFIAEPFYGNAGGMALPDGYLRALYAAVRAVGGLAIADEVQVGYGRTGRWFWAFEQQGVVPDIVCIAKAMGNGQPLGAVITTRAIADAYRTQGYFFSSSGGSPVSCVVGLAVLDEIEREGLQRNALTVGDHLKARIIELAERHRLIGTVHGSGLYMGVELVRDRTTLEPATTETAAICERMLELGVIVQPTGDRQNVLKMKPPMCLTTESADFFVDTLDRVLATGW
jgi:4-aminobutyrate aminotransferase-like enzyme/Ser/Thr protein kinase RdoA (MazF antagonist)